MSIFILAALITAVSCGYDPNLSPSRRSDMALPNQKSSGSNSSRRTLMELVELLRELKVEPEAKPRHVGIRRVKESVSGSYVVVLKEKDTRGLHASAHAKLRGTAFRGLDSRPNEAVKMITLKNVNSEEQLERILQDDDVEYVEEVSRTSGACADLRRYDASQSWGLDRIDQRDTNLNNEININYRDPLNEDVYVYVLDSGVYTAHPDFGGCAVQGQNFVPTETEDDLHGHGTHVAGIICSQTYGVNKDATVVSMKVLNVNNSGQTDWAISGINEAVTLHRARETANGGRAKSVINMSFKGPGNEATDNAVKRAREAGITVVVAAGNNAGNANDYSPARFDKAITVGGSGRNDNYYAWTNSGAVVDILAPGEDINSLAPAANGVNNRIANMWGTSQATAFVSGVASQFLMNDRDNPNLNDQNKVLDPDDIWHRISLFSVRNAAINVPAGTTTDVLNAYYCQAANARK